MILMDKTKETVTFEFEGKVYQMTREEIEGLTDTASGSTVRAMRRWLLNTSPLALKVPRA